MLPSRLSLASTVILESAFFMADCSVIDVDGETLLVFAHTGIAVAINNSTVMIQRNNMSVSSPKY